MNEIDGNGRTPTRFHFCFISQFAGSSTVHHSADLFPSDYSLSPSDSSITPHESIYYYLLLLSVDPLFFRKPYKSTNFFLSKLDGPQCTLVIF
jgi:hypothetical protein